MSDLELRRELVSAMAMSAERPLREAAVSLFRALGYSSDKSANSGTQPEHFISTIEQMAVDKPRFERTKLKLSRWKECAFLFFS